MSSSPPFFCPLRLDRRSKYLRWLIRANPDQTEMSLMKSYLLLNLAEALRWGHFSSVRLFLSVTYKGIPRGAFIQIINTATHELDPQTFS